jgi:transposase
MNEKNRKAVVAQNGRSITVLGKDGKAWRLCPASFCEWAARDPQAREVIGFGESVWEAIREAEKTGARA